MVCFALEINLWVLVSYFREIDATIPSRVNVFLETLWELNVSILCSIFIRIHQKNSTAGPRITRFCYVKLYTIF